MESERHVIESDILGTVIVEIYPIDGSIHAIDIPVTKQLTKEERDGFARLAGILVWTTTEQFLNLLEHTYRHTICWLATGPHEFVPGKFNKNGQYEGSFRYKEWARIRSLPYTGLKESS